MAGDEISARTDHVILCVGAAAVAVVSVGFVCFHKLKGLQMVDRSPHFLSSPVASLDAQSVDSRPSCEACAVLSLYTISPWCNDLLYRNS